jgi:hypothetical protein
MIVRTQKGVASPQFCARLLMTPILNPGEYSDLGEELERMYTPDMLDEDGKPKLERAKMTEDQARTLRERRASGSGTDQKTGRQETCAGEVRTG